MVHHIIKHHTAQTVDMLLGMYLDTVFRLSGVIRRMNFDRNNVIFFTFTADVFKLRIWVSFGASTDSVAGIILCRYWLRQWETTLHCNVVSHWLSLYPESITSESYEKFWKENVLLLGIHNLVMGATASLSSPTLSLYKAGDKTW